MANICFGKSATQIIRELDCSMSKEMEQFFSFKAMVNKAFEDAILYGTSMSLVSCEAGKSPGRTRREKLLLTTLED